jgi:hypothetical protein
MLASLANPSFPKVAFRHVDCDDGGPLETHKLGGPKNQNPALAPSLTQCRPMIEPKAKKKREGAYLQKPLPARQLLGESLRNCFCSSST